MDLNIIDGSVPFRKAKESNLFDNVDRYYSIEAMMLDRMEEKRLSGYLEECEGEDFRNYVLDAYTPSMIYRYMGRGSVANLFVRHQSILQDWSIG